jgi:hypothetical protein
MAPPRGVSKIGRPSKNPGHYPHTTLRDRVRAVVDPEIKLITHFYTVDFGCADALNDLAQKNGLLRQHFAGHKGEIERFITFVACNIRHAVANNGEFVKLDGTRIKVE